MSIELLSAFCLFVFVSSVTPGPNNMMVMASGLNYGILRTLPHIAGVVVGIGLLVFSVGMGMLSILDIFPFLYTIFRVACIVYIFYLAWKIATAAPLSQNKNSKAKPFSFFQAVAFQWVNPKALMMSMAAVTTYVPEASDPQFLTNVTLISILFSVISIPTISIWAFFGKGFRRILNKPEYHRIFNVTMATLLILSLYPLLN
jgi:threonine/homoserine/homoserine lactone efflux protein